MTESILNTPKKPRHTSDADSIEPHFFDYNNNQELYMWLFKMERRLRNEFNTISSAPLSKGDNERELSMRAERAFGVFYAYCSVLRNEMQKLNPKQRQIAYTRMMGQNVFKWNFFCAGLSRELFDRVLDDDTFFIAHLRYYFVTTHEYHYRTSKQGRNIYRDWQLNKKDYRTVVQEMFYSNKSSKSARAYIDECINYITAQYVVDDIQFPVYVYLEKNYQTLFANIIGVDPRVRYGQLQALPPEVLENNDTEVSNRSSYHKVAAFQLCVAGMNYSLRALHGEAMRSTASMLKGESVEEYDFGELIQTGDSRVGNIDTLQNLMNPYYKMTKKLFSPPRISIEPVYGNSSAHFIVYNSLFPRTGSLKYSGDVGYVIDELMRSIESMQSCEWGVPLGIKLHLRDNYQIESRFVTKGFFGLKISKATYNTPALPNINFAGEYLGKFEEEQEMSVRGSNNCAIQVTLPGEFIPQHCAILALSMLLGSDNIKINLAQANMTTTHETETGARLVVYGAGNVEVNFNVLSVKDSLADTATFIPLAKSGHNIPKNYTFDGKGRTDLMFCSTMRDIEVAHIVGTLIYHAEGNSALYWHKLGKSFISDFMTLMNHHSLQGIVDENYVYTKHRSRKSEERLIEDKKHWETLREVSAIAVEDYEADKRAIEQGEEPRGILFDMQKLIMHYENIMKDEYQRLVSEERIVE